jgi:hypothetical protein
MQLASSYLNKYLGPTTPRRVCNQSSHTILYEQLPKLAICRGHTEKQHLLQNILWELSLILAIFQLMLPAVYL